MMASMPYPASTSMAVVFARLGADGAHVPGVDDAVEARHGITKQDAQAHGQKDPQGEVSIQKGEVFRVAHGVLWLRPTCGRR